MAPMFFGKVLQYCAISPTEIVLDVACGLGYGCAVLSSLGNSYRPGRLTPLVSEAVRCSQICLWTML